MESTDSNGWVKLHRNIIESKLWSCSDATLRIGLYLVMAANHAPRYVRRIAVDRGQCVRSLTRISEDCHVTRKTARYAIKTLVGDGFISVDAPFGAQQGHRITVCKYNDFQSVEDKQGHTRGTRGAQEVTHEVTHEVSTNKKERIEECKNERIICDGVQQNPNTCSTPVEDNHPIKGAYKGASSNSSASPRYRSFDVLESDEIVGWIQCTKPRSELEKKVCRMDDADGWLFPITKRKAEEWREVYPKVLIEETLKEIRQRIRDTGKYRKTPPGVYAMVGRWMQNEQNKA